MRSSYETDGCGGDPSEHERGRYGLVEHGARRGDRLSVLDHELLEGRSPVHEHADRHDADRRRCHGDRGEDDPGGDAAHSRAAR